MPITIFFFLIFIVLSAFFSASETAIFSLSNLKIRKLSERYPGGRRVKNLLKRPTRLLSAIVFGNLLVNIGLTSFSTAIFVKIFGANGLFFSILISGTLILFFGEIFPKTFAIYMAQRLSLLLAPGIDFFSRIFSPIIFIIEKVVKYFSSFIIRKPKQSTLSDEEFKSALLLSKKDGQISAQEEQLIGQVLEFKDTQASEILTARIDIEGINNSLSQGQVLDILRKKKHSKFPVYEDSLDHIVGILYAKDVFLRPDSDYHTYLRKPIFIPESKKIDDILKLFLETKEKVAIVLDEYGGTEGLITFEDIVEEIFGEIYDEFEVALASIDKVDRNKWRIHGKTAIKAVNADLLINLEEDEDTIAGLILSHMERIPKPGEEIIVYAQGRVDSKMKKIEFTIERATARRIVSIITTVFNLE